MKKRVLNITKQFFTFILVGALLFNYASPSALAGFTVNINGNGGSSDNSVSIDNEQQATIVQNNDIDIENNIQIDSNTGNNEVSENVGDVTIETGSINTTVDVSNTAGINTASAGCGDCGDSELIVGIEGNGADSSSTVDVGIANVTNLQQANQGTITNNVNIDLNTGYNTASKNVGDTSITTGSITGGVQLNNAYGVNTASVGQSDWSGVINVNGNGAYAYNSVSVTIDTDKNVVQNNDFDIINNVLVQLNTGGNNCFKNVGPCLIATGDITFGVDIDNQGGFNEFDDCGKCKPSDEQEPEDESNGGTDPADDTEDDGDPSIIDGVKDIIDDIIDKIVPTASAAEEDPEEVLGVAELPTTGFGEMPTIHWVEILIGLYLIAAGVYMRKVIKNLELKLEQRHLSSTSL